MNRFFSQRRVVISGVALLLLLAAGWVAWQQRRTTERVAAIPEPPNLSRWPARFVEAVNQATDEARTARNPLEAMVRLEALYHANGFEAQAERVVGWLEKHQPRVARWAYLAADLRIRQSDQDGYERKLRRALELESTYMPGWIRLGDLRVERKQFAEAESCYDRAQALAPGDARTEFAVISFQAWHGKRGDPRASLRQLCGRFPGIVQLHELLSEMETAAGDPAAARREKLRAAAGTRYLDTTDPWLDVLGLACHDPTRLGLLAYKLQREARWVDAEALLTHAVGVAPTDAGLRVNLAQVHEQAGRPAQALQVLEQAARDIQTDVVLPVQWARRLSLEHRTDEALAVLRGALVRWPADPALHLALGYTLRDANRHAEALPAFAEAARLDPAQVEPLYYQGYSLLALGKREEAKRQVERALVLRPDYPEALTLRASLAIEAGEIATAEPLIKRLYELRPDDPEARVLFATLHLLLGLAQEEAGAPDQAERLYRVGLTAETDFAPLLRQAGRLAWSRKRWSEAVAYLAKYQIREPADLEALLWYGLALRGMGQAEPSRALLTQGRSRAEAAGDRSLATQFARALQVP
ncbi:MAG: tetratricopeptide repeat protein [Opitutaceae bacterium]